MNDLNAAPSSTEQAAAQPHGADIPAAQEVAAVLVGETATGADAATASTPSPITGAAESATPVSPTSTNTENQGAGNGEITATTSAAEAPNADAPTAPAGDATPVAGEDPNAAASVAVESPAESSPSATTAPSDAGESQTDASTLADVPLHVSIAHHLEAIFQLAKANAEKPETTVTQEALGLKQHIAEVMHRIHNGMAVTQGELVQKLEALFHKL